jgi:hypothetical protein
MFGENGFCDHGAHTAGPNDAQDRGERYGQGGESDHAYQILAALKTLRIQRNLEFATDRLPGEASRLNDTGRWMKSLGIAETAAAERIPSVRNNQIHTVYTTCWAMSGSG